MPHGSKSLRGSLYGLQAEFQVTLLPTPVREITLLIKLVLTPRVMQRLLPNGVNGKCKSNMRSSDLHAAAPECTYSNYR